MNSFKAALRKELLRSSYNNYGIENYDEYRFGKIEFTHSASIYTSLKQAIKRIIAYESPSFEKLFAKLWNSIKPYESGLEFLFTTLSHTDQNLIVKLIAYRLLGYRKVKLPLNNKNYWRAIELVRTLKIPGDTYDPHFLHFVLHKFDLKNVGYNLKIYFGDAGIVTDFLIQQYTYKNQGRIIVEAEKGDVVLDVGACWGDTALYFATKVGEAGKVYSFEFIPDNIKLFQINTSLNPNLDKQIQLIKNPVSNVSGKTIYFKDQGPGSKINSEPFEGQTGSTTTITIDDFIEKYNIPQVDFIKMDIEGAEPIALQGAIKTIKKHKPKLAISIYHSMEDFVNIPKWIIDLNLGYELFIGHYTIHAEETVCFAKPKNK